MSSVSLIAEYEQQYAVLTAEITSEIGKLSRCEADERRSITSRITGKLDEVNELLEQIGLEVRDVGATQRAPFEQRLHCYQAELKRLKEEFRRCSRPTADSTAISLYDTSELSHATDEPHTRLLDNAERIERSGNRLADGYRTILETESIGTSVLADLSQQRETLQRARSRLRDTNEDIRQANKSVNAMIMRSLREKGMLYGIGLVFVIVVCLSIYFSLSK